MTKNMLMHILTNTAINFGKMEDPDGDEVDVEQYLGGEEAERLANAILAYQLKHMEG